MCGFDLDEGHLALGSPQRAALNSNDPGQLATGIHPGSGSGEGCADYDVVAQEVFANAVLSSVFYDFRFSDNTAQLGMSRTERHSRAEASLLTSTLDGACGIR